MGCALKYEGTPRIYIVKVKVVDIQKKVIVCMERFNFLK